MEAVVEHGLSKMGQIMTKKVCWLDDNSKIHSTKSLTMEDTR